MIIIKNKKEIAVMRQGGKILAQIMKKIVKEVKPGVTTGQLEEMACLLIKQAGARPSFLGYQSKHEQKPFPTALCASINQEVVHSPALPARQLKSGDIIGLDLGLEYPYGPAFCGVKTGYFTDMAVTVAVGKINKEAQKLIRVTKQALNLAVRQVRPGNPLNNIGLTIEQYVKRQGFTVVRDLVGHGVGKAVHEDPQIHNYEVALNNKIILKPGMTLAIEPMVNAGDWRIKNSQDGFSILTADESLSAHFEHTVLVTENGCEILTTI